jgi:hypothetical protein
MSAVAKDKPEAAKRSGLRLLIRAEFPLILGFGTAAIFLWFGARLVEALKHPAAP